MSNFDLTKIKAVSFDFWDTICSYNEDLLFVEKRIDFLANFLDSAHFPRTKVALAVHSIFDYFENLWHTEHRTPCTPEMLKYALNRIGAKLSADQFALVVDYYENLITNEGAVVAADAVQVLHKLAEKFKLVLISDTGFEPGRVIRQLMQKLDILNLFEYQVFSDETGYSKPDLRAFQLAESKVGQQAVNMVHIGDRESKDIAGAKNAGMQSILYTGFRDDDLKISKADLKIGSWQELAAVFGV